MPDKAATADSNEFEHNYAADPRDLSREASNSIKDDLHQRYNGRRLPAKDPTSYSFRLQKQQGAVDVGDHVLAHQDSREATADKSVALLPKNYSSTSTSQSKLGERTRPATLRERILFDTWFYEYIAISISTACLIAIGVVLEVYDQRPSPQLKYGLTLNTIISVLATGSKAGLIFVIASSISQLKWCRVHKKQRPLRELQAYDDASRGFSGAISMLFTRSGQSLASIGAIITILAVAFDPFVQQLLAYPITKVPNASSPSAVTKQAALFNVSGDDMAFLSAMNAGIWADSDEFARNPICASGNCTWSPFSSVGWCSKCEDITSSASASDCDFGAEITGQNFSVEGRGPVVSVPCAIHLDKGASVDIPFLLYYVRDPSSNHTSWLSSPPKEVVWMANGTYSNGNGGQGVGHHLGNFNGVETPIMVLAHASLHVAPKNDPLQGLAISHVEQCVLSMCEQTYENFVSNGVPSSTLLSTSWGRFYYWDSNTRKTVNDTAANSLLHDDYWPGYMFWTSSPEQSQNVSFAYEPNNEALEQTAHFATTDPEHLATIVDSAWYISTNSVVTGQAAIQCYGGGGFPTICDTQEAFRSDAVRKIVTTGLRTVVGNIAASLTRLGLDQSDKTVAGTINVSKVYVRVRWQWFILPCLLELASIAFLVTTILTSKHKNVRLWKSSVYALLYHGLERELLHKQPIEDTVSGMRHVGRSVPVRLKTSDLGNRVALRREQEKDSEES